MKPAYPNKRKRPIALNMTSMIDIIFLLLVFFVFTADLKPVEEILPTDLSLTGAISSPVRVEIPREERDLGEIHLLICQHENGQTDWQVNQKKCQTLDEVEAVLRQLRQIRDDIPVTVDPQGDPAIEKVLDVYDISRRAGLKKIQFATSPATVP
ncbi:MAG: biopolymer transporter ExbD [Thermoguttaceae bacterium]|nr:biopolymer transporter ExbD [Thermoguttaceae bacterium]